MGGNLLSSLQLGKRSLNTQRVALGVAGHNISNVNTPNFARQRTDITVGSERNWIGGAEVSQISQVRDRILDERVRQYTQETSNWSTQSNQLSQIEALFNDLGGSGISDVLSDFWNSWQDLTLDPESESTRLATIGTGAALADSLNRIGADLYTAHTDLNAELEIKVEQVNSILEAAAKLNGEIASFAGSGGANDARTALEQQLATLSELVDFRTIENEDGLLSIQIDNNAVVDRIHFEKLEVKSIATSLQDRSAAKVYLHQQEIRITGGSIAGLIDVRDNKLSNLIERLEELASQLIDSTNERHRSGYGLDGSSGLDFFSGTNINNISINTELQESPDKLGVAGVPNAEGDNQVALSISQIQYRSVMSNGTETLGDFYNSIFGSVGVFAGQADRNETNSSLLVEQLEVYRESISGVSLDEEMTNLIQFQKGYEASARYVKIVDQMLQTLMNM